MPMRRQPPGVRRVPRGAERPPLEYDVLVDGEPAGIAERLPYGEWQFRRDGIWPRKFGPRGGFLAGAAWLADVHRAARSTAEPVSAAEAAEVRKSASPVPLSPVTADPFRGDQFADPLA